MITPAEKNFFLEQGYLHVPGVLTGDHLALIQDEFDRVWELEKPKVNQHRLLKYKAFIDLIEHPPILARQQAIFGHQVQLLQYDLLRQGPGSTFPERAWHRDFVFPGDRPLAINTIIMLNEMSDARGRSMPRLATPSLSMAPSGTRVGAIPPMACAVASISTLAIGGSNAMKLKPPFPGRPLQAPLNSAYAY